MPENYVLLERTELNTTAASVTFANIPQTGYTDLKLVVSGRFSSGSGFNLIDFNGLSTANFSNRVLEGTGSSAVSFVAGNTNYAGALNGSGDTANTFSNEEIYIPNYAGNTFKSISFDAVMETNGTTAYIDMGALLWSNTAAITSIRLTTHTGAAYAVGSTFSLYGIAALGTTPAIAPKATGGNIIDYDGTYWIHTFLTSGTFTPQQGLTCDYLVLAGGGSGGGAYIGGGGGAGGLRSSVTATGGGGIVESPLSLISGTNYAVTVGAGGATKSGAGVGNSGSNSIFSTITSTGGGGGGGNATNGQAGGSGGGASSPNNGTFGAGTANQGYSGGGGFDGVSQVTVAGGGGGAGAVGQTAPQAVNNNAGAGGNGVANSISGTSVTYGGGGGGGNDQTNRSPWSGNGGAGGTGGGGAGGSYQTTASVAGTVNRGGGGGGSSSNASPYNVGAAGGSGIVIIRYPAV
jgi:hypothetical protein